MTPTVMWASRRSVLAFVLAVSVSAGSFGSTVAADVVTDIADFAFEQDIVIEAGTHVRWHNVDPVPHTVSAADGTFESGSLAQNATFEQSFSAPGVVSYFCSFHPTMTGTVTVLAPEVDAPPTPMLDDTTSAGTTTVLDRTAVFDTDPLGIGGVALTVLVPRGWFVQGGPVWRHEYANLATFEGRVASPDLFQAVEFFPFFPQVWQEGGLPFFAPGSNYLGHDVRAPMDVGTFLETLVLPAYRGDFGPRILEREPLPEVAQAYVGNSLPGTKVVAERVRTEHFVNGESMLEEFTVVLSFTPNPAIPGRMTWTPRQLFSIRAPAAEFEGARPILQAVVSSPVIDPRWEAGYEYVLGLAIQNGLEAIKAAGAASRIISQTNAEISDIITEGYRQRQATNDRIFDAISQTIRGVETYADPIFGGTLELPNGYTDAYASHEGSVILSNEPGFDPVQAFPGQTWELLTIAR